MDLLSQPFTGQLGERLIKLLSSGEYRNLTMVVAFAKTSGVLRLREAFERFRADGGHIEVYVGVDLEGTSYEALASLLRQTDSLNVIHLEMSQTFHPKIYDLIGDRSGVIIAGSNNLTGGGLWTNVESSLCVSFEETDDEGRRLQKEVEDYIGRLKKLGDSVRQIKDIEDIEQLCTARYVEHEVAGRVRRGNERSGEGENVAVLFGKGVPAKLPRLPKSKPVAASHSSDAEGHVSGDLVASAFSKPATEDDTVWFETRAMTGGSRNILDLSSKSLVEHDFRGRMTAVDLIGGAVEFFGVDPSETLLRKTLTINFDGIDYQENVILYPTGDKANGTWRLQVKGKSSSGERITQALKNKGGELYLVHKVLTFTKVGDVGDYYYMSVFPDSDLQKFREASSVLAYNGQNPRSKQWGFLRTD